MAQVEAFRNARKTIPWPVSDVTPLPDPEQAARALDLYLRTMRSRAPEDWRPSDPVLVAGWANTAITLDVQNQEIRAEGWVVPSMRNPAVMTRNPRLDVVAYLTGLQLQYARSIGVSGLPADAKTVRNAQKEVAKARRLNDDDGSLLAGGSASVDSLFATPGRSARQ